jgi:hypothetical protein
MGEPPRFPAPGNETGYREASAPTDHAAPEAPVQPRHIVVTRPDDPDVARAKANVDEVAEAEARFKLQQRERRNAIVAVVLLVAFWLWIFISKVFEHPRRRF